MRKLVEHRGELRSADNADANMAVRRNAVENCCAKPVSCCSTVRSTLVKKTYELSGLPLCRSMSAPRHAIPLQATIQCGLGSAP